MNLILHTVRGLDHWGDASSVDVLIEAGRGQLSGCIAPLAQRDWMYVCRASAYGGLDREARGDLGKDGLDLIRTALRVIEGRRTCKPDSPEAYVAALLLLWGSARSAAIALTLGVDRTGADDEGDGSIEPSR